MSPVRIRFLLLGVFALPHIVASTTHACPGCPQSAPTFAEEFDTMDVVVIARLIAIPASTKGVKANNGELPLGKFEVTRVLKGAPASRPREIIETSYLGEAKVGTSFLIMGIDPRMLRWSTPLSLTTRAPAYLEKVVKLPKDSKQRLEFFLNYLENEDPELARDAYNEFARAPYDAVRAVKGAMNHDQLVGWITSGEVPQNHRRLYLLMLGVYGSDKDWPFLEKLIKSTDRQEKQGLDSVISCYLQLRGAAGVPLIEDLFLKDKKCDYADTYATIIALRFQLSYGKAVPKERALAALHHMLERPDLADLIIPDLAQWEDWGHVDKLFELFKNGSDKANLARVPVINYLRLCPHPKAKELLLQCEKIDPQAAQRANSLFLNKPKEAASAEKS